MSYIFSFVLKISYAVKDMWESEQQYLKDLQFALDTYHAKFPTLPDLPSRLQGQSERIFGNLPQLRDFHHRFVFVQNSKHGLCFYF